MIYSIENETYRVSVKSEGAELCSFYDKTAEHEYIWEGDPAFWTGTSPLLFPIVGRLRDDIYHLNGKEYHMPKHGFAKKMEFEVEVQTADELVFLLRDTEETRVGFPYAFELRVRYAFVAGGFVMEFSVKNVNDETMYFSLGAHPAFAIALGDKVVLDEPETLAAFKLDENFLRGKVQQPVFDNSRELVITTETFAKDALIFDGIKSKGASVIRANGKNVHVAFDAPCLGIWAKPAAPYVCIEPWHGIDDMCDAGHDIAKKERIEVLGAGETWVFPVTITTID